MSAGRGASTRGVARPAAVADLPAGAVVAGRFDLCQGRSVPLTLDLCCPPGSTACAEPTSVCSTTAHDHAGRAANAASAPIVMERDREQADLPTEQPPSGEDPRVPASDAHSRRSRHPGGPPPQGSHRTVGLSRPAGVLPAAHRLRSSADFATVTRSGRRVRSGDLVVYLAGADHGGRFATRPVSDQTSSRPARAGLIVSRQVGGSVVRHQVSRRLRAQLAGRILYAARRLSPGRPSVALRRASLVAGSRPATRHRVRQAHRTPSRPRRSDDRPPDRAAVAADARGVATSAVGRKPGGHHRHPDLPGRLEFPPAAGLPVSAQLQRVHGAGDRRARRAARQLVGRPTDRALSPAACRRIRPGARPATAGGTPRTGTRVRYRWNR